MKWIDLRSDTVTQPTQAMREAMFSAEVGDDVFGDDPTVVRLEALAAQMLGKEAALFVTSGTQGNAVSVMSHTRRGDAVVMGEHCHIFEHEAGAYVVLAGAVPSIAKDVNGVLCPDSVAALLTDDSDVQIAPTGLVCLENALSNGGVVPVENMRQIYQIAHAKGVPVHLDGARIFNAAAALGVEVKALTQHCDSVMCCLSKGLCAPAGSIVAGSAAFIHKARKWRKMLGGGLRQVGFLAAAGELSLREMTQRVAADHENAQYLAKGLAAVPGVHVESERVQINLLFYTVDWSAEKRSGLVAFMKERGIKITDILFGEYRMVTHNDITRADCDTVLAAMAEYAQRAVSE